jgi:ABC-type sugar transport system ATPase subunit
MIFGADHPDSGEILLDGQKLRLKSPRDAVNQGICLLTEDRKSQGLVLGLSVRENFGLPNLPLLSRLGFVRQRLEQTEFSRYVNAIRIKIASPEQLAKNLSGGNQQKVVLAKWLQRNADVIIIDEPTRGIDVGAKAEIYGLINQLAAAGKAVLMISSELPEVLGMSDRILVMSEGRLVGEITDVASATQQQIMALATPGQKPTGEQVHQ